MDLVVTPTLLILAAYLIGSIPFGLLIAKSKGIDIRKHGSGNIGATNVGRVLGKKFFILCFILDALKGALPTLAFGIYTGLIAGEQPIIPSVYWWWLAAMVAPVMGHMFSIFLGFTGGKGVATGLGSLLAVFPVMTAAALVALVVFLASLKVWKYVGLSSSLASASLPLTATVMVFGFGDRLTGSWPAIVVAAALAAVVISKHRGNLQRTFAGTEPKAGSARSDHEKPASANQGD